MVNIVHRFDMCVDLCKFKKEYVYHFEQVIQVDLYDSRKIRKTLHKNVLVTFV